MTATKSNPDPDIEARRIWPKRKRLLELANTVSSEHLEEAIAALEKLPKEPHPIPCR